MDIYVWGTSPLAGRIVGNVISINSISGFVDNYYDGKSFMDKPVMKPTNLINRNYDAIIVASTYTNDIYNQSIEIGLDINKMIFPFGNVLLSDLNEDYAFVEKVLGKEYSEVIRQRNHMIQDCEARGYMCLEGSSLKEERSYKNDFIRHRTFELCVKEIQKRKLNGAVAELGVYKGQFAQYINAAFPNRKLYLFDTFEGFDEKEAQVEVHSGNASLTWFESFKNTSIHMVMQRMLHKNMVDIRQGRFPETTGELENEKFVFVSIDVDLETPIYDGLCFFYPRLQEGGYIFVHDYNGPLLGVEHAVDRYERDNMIHFCKLPICDTEGTLIITK